MWESKGSVQYVATCVRSMIRSYEVVTTPLNKQINLGPSRMDVQNLQIFFVGYNIYVFWIDLRIGNDDILLKGSTVGGGEQ